MTKRIFSILLAVIIFTMIPLGVSAEAAVQPRYTYTAVHSAALVIKDDVATVEGYVDGYSSVTSIRLTLTLQKKVLWWWSDVTEWGKTVQDNYASMSKTESVGGGTYRVKLVATVYSGSASETVEGYSSEKKN